jgi:hypothetical protein
MAASLFFNFREVGLEGFRKTQIIKAQPPGTAYYV